MINYDEEEESKNPWRTMFLGLLSPHAAKYHNFMVNTIHSIKSKNKDEVEIKT